MYVISCQNIMRNSVLETFEFCNIKKQLHFLLSCRYSGMLVLI